MMTNKNCTEPTPCMNEASALYFTKAPGEEYYKVYARYKDSPEWVPIAITETANLGLQQVRDVNRNISMGRGSYADAHFYLRSADGNNMTSAFFTNVQGGGIQVGNALGYAALNLQPEGGQLTYGGKEVATRDWVIDNRGQVVTYGVNYGANMVTVQQNSILYHYGNEPDAPIAQTGYSINGSVGGVSSVQLYIATGSSTGQNPDGFFWRGNNAGGPGWPGPWRQVASREWVIAQGYTTAADIASGTYTPTFGNYVGAVDSVSGSCMYMRSGNIVTVNGFLQITMAATVDTYGSFDISLPIPSTFTYEDCAGMGSGLEASSKGIMIIANETTNKANAHFVRSTETGIIKVTISFTYKIA